MDSKWTTPARPHTATSGKRQQVDGVPHIMVVEARFYEDLVDELVNGAIAELDAAEVSFERYEVPGALEVPAAIRFAVNGRDERPSSHHFDGYVALGCVIRGETAHYDIVAGESARGLQDLALNFGVAVGNGILTCENREQAWARAATDGGNKGGRAARACLNMVRMKWHFRSFR